MLQGHLEYGPTPDSRSLRNQNLGTTLLPAETARGSAHCGDGTASEAARRANGGNGHAGDVVAGSPGRGRPMMPPLSGLNARVAHEESTWTVVGVFPPPGFAFPGTRLQRMPRPRDPLAHFSGVRSPRLSLQTVCMATRQERGSRDFPYMCAARRRKCSTPTSQSRWRGKREDGSVGCAVPAREPPAPTRASLSARPRPHARRREVPSQGGRCQPEPARAAEEL